MLTYDTYQRAIDYLRISITDRCNLRCVYCMPEQGVPTMRHADILRYEEIETITRAAAALGIRTAWITRRVRDPGEKLHAFVGTPPDWCIADLAELPDLLLRSDAEQ